jgi:hypothetical protein
MRPGSVFRQPPKLAGAVALAAVLAVSDSTRADEIPVTVTDIRLDADRRSLTFAVRNDGRQRLIAWSLGFVLEYPDGYISRKGRTTHCHTTSIERLVDECEISPSLQREQRPLYFSLRSGQLPMVTTVSVRSAVFESDGPRGTAIETWKGDRGRIEGLLRDDAERRQVWKGILRVLEASRENEGSADPVQAAYDRLGREGPKHDLTEMVRGQLERIRSKGPTAGLDQYELLVRSARLAASDRQPHGDHRGR